jgi:hypothetical protein
MPRTREGVAVAHAIDRIGIWRRAGVAGTIVGLDLAEAQAVLPRGCDVEFAKRLFVVAEGAFCAAAFAQSAKPDGGA